MKKILTTGIFAAVFCLVASSAMAKGVHPSKTPSKEVKTGDNVTVATDYRHDDKDAGDDQKKKPPKKKKVHCH